MDHAPKPIRIGISSCLLGQEVRFDGGHKRDQFLVDTLGRQVEWVPVCPEVEMGLGTPRETLRLVKAQGRNDSFRMVTTRTGIDHTDGMNRWAARRLDELARFVRDLFEQAHELIHRRIGEPPLEIALAVALREHVVESPVLVVP